MKICNFFRPAGSQQQEPGWVSCVLVFLATFAGQDLACLRCCREDSAAWKAEGAETAGGCSHANQHSQPERGASTLCLHGDYPITPCCTPGSPVQRGHGPEQKAGLGPRQVVGMVTREPELKKYHLPCLPSSLQACFQKSRSQFGFLTKVVVLSSSIFLTHMWVHVCVCLLHLKYPVSLQKGCEVWWIWSVTLIVILPFQLLKQFNLISSLEHVDLPC